MSQRAQSGFRSGSRSTPKSAGRNAHSCAANWANLNPLFNPSKDPRTVFDVNCFIFPICKALLNFRPEISFTTRSKLDFNRILSNRFRSFRLPRSSATSSDSSISRARFRPTTTRSKRWSKSFNCSAGATFRSSTRRAITESKRSRSSRSCWPSTTFASQWRRSWWRTREWRRRRRTMPSCRDWWRNRGHEVSDNYENRRKTH